MTVKEKKSKTPNEVHPNGERGVALIIALLAITLLMGIGMALMLSSSTESMIHASFRRDSLAFFAAGGGLEEARGRMGPDAAPATTSPSTSIKLPPCNPPSPCPAADLTTTSAYYIRLNSSINPTTSCTYLGMNCADLNPPTGTVTFFPTTQPGTQMPYAWVKVELATEAKLNRDVNGVGGITTAQVYWVGRNLTTTAGSPPSPAYILTALSIQPGRATRTLREVIAVGTIPSLPGPLTLDGCGSTYLPPSSNPFSLSGMDAGALGQNSSSLGTVCNGDTAAIQASIPDKTPNQNSNYPGNSNNGCTGGGL